MQRSRTTPVHLLLAEGVCGADAHDDDTDSDDDGNMKVVIVHFRR